MRIQRFIRGLLVCLMLAGLVTTTHVPVQATVNEVTAANRYIGNGSTTAFTYSFRILTTADIEVLVDSTVKTLTTDYTVSGAGDSGGGTVTFVTAPASATAVTLIRKQALEQQSDYVANQSYAARAEIIEQDLDKVAMTQQMQAEVLVRSLKIPKKSTLSGNQLEIDIEACDDMYLKANAAGTGLECAALTATGTIATPVTPTKGGTGVDNTTGFTEAGLPAAGTAGRIARVTDAPGGLRMDTGSAWSPVTFGMINVMDPPFNCKGDGTTDDKACFQAAFDAAANRKIVVPKPSTAYKLSSAVVITTQNWIIEGTGAPTIKPDAGIVAFQIGNASTHPDRWAVRDLDFDCTNGTAVALDLHGGTNGEIHGNRFNKCGNGTTKGAVHIAQDGGFIGGLLISRNFFQPLAINSYGIRIPSGETIQQPITILQNYFAQNGEPGGTIRTAEGISFTDNGASISIIGNRFESLKSPIRGFGTGTVHVTGNYFEGNQPPTGEGDVTLDRHASIISNRFHGSTLSEFAIQLNTNSGAVVLGNQSHDHTVGFLRANSFDDITILNNDTTETYLTIGGTVLRRFILNPNATPGTFDVQDYRGVYTSERMNHAQLQINRGGLTIADSGDGSPGTATLDTANSYTDVTCNDVHGCTLTIAETNAYDGQIYTLTGATANVTTINDTAGVTEMSGNFAMGQYDSITFIYQSDRYTQLSESDN